MKKALGIAAAGLMAVAVSGCAARVSTPVLEVGVRSPAVVVAPRPVVRAYVPRARVRVRL